jgi:hypothetical protein
MKKFLMIALISMMALPFVSCNDDGTGEKLPTDKRYLIQNESKPLKPQYAAVGISAWVLVSAVGIAGHKYVNRKK